MKRVSKKAEVNKNTGPSLEDAIKSLDENSSKNQEKTERKSKLHLLGRIDRFITTLFPGKSQVLHNAVDGFYLNNSYMDIFQVLSIDFQSCSEEEFIMHRDIWDRLFRTESFDLKIVAVNMPIDTSSHIQFEQSKYYSTNNPSYQRELAKDVKELQDDFKDRQSKDFYIFIFAETFEELMNIKDRIRVSLCDNNIARELSPKQKVAVLSKFSNPYNRKRDFISVPDEE